MANTASSYTSAAQREEIVKACQRLVKALDVDAILRVALARIQQENRPQADQAKFLGMVSRLFYEKITKQIVSTSGEHWGADDVVFIQGPLLGSRSDLLERTLARYRDGFPGADIDVFECFKRLLWSTPTVQRLRACPPPIRSLDDKPSPEEATKRLFTFVVVSVIHQLHESLSFSAPPIPLAESSTSAPQAPSTSPGGSVVTYPRASVASHNSADARIKWLLARRSPEDRRLYDLTVRAGLAYHEIAELLRRPTAEVKAQWEALKRFLTENFDKDGDI
ncbi:MAG: hypothetical protein AAGA68_10465 [Pseudomonadota bacterium]